jgi:hypothetical protein
MGKSRFSIRQPPDWAILSRRFAAENLDRSRGFR